MVIWGLQVRAWAWKLLSRVQLLTMNQNSPGQNLGVGNLSLLQGIFSTQGSNPSLPNCKWILYQLSHKGSPRILEWADYPFSRGSSWPKNWTGVSCIAGRFFINWSIKEALELLYHMPLRYMFDLWLNIYRSSQFKPCNFWIFLLKWPSF